VFEAMNVNGEEFGAQRLLEVVERSRALDAKAIVAAISAAVEAFRGGIAPNDDMTAVAVKVTA
jgi:serine phosphatase RsbU (regulator of sigma subunit)